MALGSDLAYRTAMTAGPFVDSLAGDVMAIAHSLRAGDLDDALANFETSADRLQRFLTFLVVASELLVDTRPALGAILADYSRRLLSTASRIQCILDERDLVGLTIALEHDLARTLEEYSAYRRDVQIALQPAAA